MERDSLEIDKAQRQLSQPQKEKLKVIEIDGEEDFGETINKEFTKASPRSDNIVQNRLTNQSTSRIQESFENFMQGQEKINIDFCQPQAKKQL